jgi:uncharacterized protein (DUF427 family)
MTVQLDRTTRAWLPELRVARSPWHVRGIRDGAVVVDAAEALLVWEPRRATPVYAVPEQALRGRLEDGGTARTPDASEERLPVLHPGVPFAVHTAPGTALRLVADDGPAIDVFRIDDPLLGDAVLVDFAALAWFEEDLEQPAHPHDPFQRIDVRPVDARVVLRLGDAVVVDTVRAKRLAETHLPLRWYVPPEDVLVPLEPSATVSWCAYKGRATYRSAVVGDRRVEDLFWTYEDPLPDGRDVLGLLGVYAERLEVEVQPAAGPAASVGA